MLHNSSPFLWVQNFGCSELSPTWNRSDLKENSCTECINPWFLPPEVYLCCIEDVFWMWIFSISTAWRRWNLWLQCTAVPACHGPAKESCPAVPSFLRPTSGWDMLAPQRKCVYTNILCNFASMKFLAMGSDHCTGHEAPLLDPPCLR